MQCKYLARDRIDDFSNFSKDFSSQVQFVVVVIGGVVAMSVAYKKAVPIAFNPS